MIRERLWQFLDWLESNVADHEAVLLLQWLYRLRGGRRQAKNRKIEMYVAVGGIADELMLADLRRPQN